MSNADIEHLDRLEARAVEAIERTYDMDEADLAARFWIQKGIEGMRLAIAEEWKRERRES